MKKLGTLRVSVLLLLVTVYLSLGLASAHAFDIISVTWNPGPPDIPCNMESPISVSVYGKTEAADVVWQAIRLTLVEADTFVDDINWRKIVPFGGKRDELKTITVTWMVKCENCGCPGTGHICTPVYCPSPCTWGPDTKEGDCRGRTSPAEPAIEEGFSSDNFGETTAMNHHGLGPPGDPPNTPTPPGGGPLLVGLPHGVSVGFPSVTSGGNTVVTEGPPGHAAPSGIAFTGNQYDIQTDASYTSPVTVAIPYDEGELPHGIAEDQLGLFHWNGSKWEDVAVSVNTVNNTVFGEVNSLSPFIVGAPIPATAHEMDHETAHGGYSSLTNKCLQWP